MARTTCRDCGKRIDRAAMLAAAEQGSVFLCPCGRRWSPDTIFALLHLSGEPIYKGFPLRRPRCPEARRKNGAILSFSAGGGSAEAPATEEIRKGRRFFPRH